MKLFINLSKNISFWAIIAVASTLIIAYGQTLGFYFWQDDSALIFKLQHQEEPAGSYGAGIIGEGPYKYLVTPFIPFFPIFGLNPFWYFLVGFLSYGIATIVFYFFAKETFQNKKAGFISTLIFAAGYVGSGTMFRISNSWQTNFGIILALLSFWAYVKFARNKSKLFFYLLALLLFYLSVKFVYIRSHSLIVLTLAIDLLFIVFPFAFSKIPGFMLRQIPFWIIFYNWYLKGETTGSSGIFSVADSLLKGRVEIFIGFFATVGNVYVPSILQKLIHFNFHKEQLVLLLVFILFSYFLLRFFSADKRLKFVVTILLVASYFVNRWFISNNLFWYKLEADYIAGAIGLYVTILIIILAILLKDKKKIALTLIFGVVIILSQVFGYFIQYKETIFDTTHRYLSYSFIGYCLVYGGVCFALYEKITVIRSKSSKYMSVIALLPLFLIIGINLSLGAAAQNRFLSEVSRPTANFYQELKQYVPTIENVALFHFDVDERNIYQQQFKNFFSVGSMPDSTALAIYYGVDRYDLNLVNNFDEILFKLKQKQADINKIYSFYYGQDGLVDTTKPLRSLLNNGSSVEILSLTQGTNSSLIQKSDIKTVPLTPILLMVKAKIIPLTEGVVFSGLKTGQQTDIVLSFLAARARYYKDVKVTSLSQWKYQEIQKIADNNPDTSWRGDRIYWHENKHEQFILDLGSIKQIDRVIWTNVNYTQTPTSYTIDVSTNKTNWKTVKKIINGPERFDGETVIENFDSTGAKFVRMDITNTLANDSPSIAEFEVVESIYKDVNLLKAFSFMSKPFNSVKSGEELGLIFSKIASFLNIEAIINTDKGQVKKSVKIENFNSTNIYEFIIPPGGTIIKDISVTIPNAPVKIEIQSATLQNLNFETIKNMGLIEEFIEN